MISRAAYRERFGYVLAYDFKPSKRPEVVFSTLNSEDVSGMTAEMESVAKRSRRVEKPCAHFCFSLAPDETLTAQQWADFFAVVVEEFGALQAVGVTHADTPQVNAHLVMNRVRADGKAWSTSNDRQRLRSICGQFERKFGLHVLPQKSDAPRISKTELEKADRLFRQGKAPTPIPARMELGEVVRATLAVARTPEDFTEKLAEHGITVRWRIESGVITGSSFAKGEVSISGKNAGVTVRAVREQFSQHEHHRIPTPGCPAPALVGNLEGAIACRTRSAERRIVGRERAVGAAECPARKTHRRDGDHGGDAAAAAGEPSLAQILDDAVKLGCLGLLGLIDLLLTDGDPTRRPHAWSRSRRPQMIFPSLPL